MYIYVHKCIERERESPARCERTCQIQITLSIDFRHLRIGGGGGEGGEMSGAEEEGE